MMNTKGFTLIELMVVVSVIAILSMLLGSSLHGSIGSGRMESEVKELQTDLMQARMRAVHRNHLYFVQIDSAAGTYQITEDTNDSGVSDAGDTNFFSTPKPLADTVAWTGAWDGNLRMDTRGMISAALGFPPNIQFVQGWSSGKAPDYDCLLVSSTMVNIGKINGGACVVK